MSYTTGEVALVCRQGMNYTPGDAENKYILAITKSYAHWKIISRQIIRSLKL